MSIKSLHHADGNPLNPYDWVKPQAADVWDMNDVPPCPGIYEVVSVHDDGTPRAIALVPAAANDEPGRYERAAPQQFPGTLYIGKACNLRKRFGQLVTSWRSDAKPPYPHKSRETWDRLDEATKAMYPFASIRLRFQAMSKQDWERMSGAIKERKKKTKGVKDVEKVLKDNPGLGAALLWSGSGRNREYEPVTAITTTENRRMETFKEYHGIRPLLNRINGETLGTKPDDAFFEQLERDRLRLEAELEELFDDGMS